MAEERREQFQKQTTEYEEPSFDHPVWSVVKDLVTLMMEKHGMQLNEFPLAYRLGLVTALNLMHADDEQAFETALKDSIDHINTMAQACRRVTKEQRAVGALFKALGEIPSTDTAQ